MPLLDIQNVNKQYNKHTALTDLSLQIAPQRIFGLLGPNGAGKTSLIRIITQITAPDSGKILFDGEPLQQKHIAAMGYMPEERGLYKKMPIGEQILYLAQLKGLKRHDANARAKYWFERLEMQSWWNKKVEELSKGMQQKVQFVATVMHNPSLIILDEPFTGFDPINANIIRDEILELRRQGATIIFSTHRMETVEELCDDIALIHKSKKILDGTKRDIKLQYRTSTFTIGYEGTLPAAVLLRPHTAAQGEYYSEITLQLLPNESPNDLLNALMPHISICDFREIIPSINDIFIAAIAQTQSL
jgi:ABC-2 type transport system ATP-binding protein